MKEINLAGGGGAISKCLGKITKLLVCKGVARKISHIYPIYIKFQLTITMTWKKFHRVPKSALLHNLAAQQVRGRHNGRNGWPTSRHLFNSYFSGFQRSNAAELLVQTTTVHLPTWAGQITPACSHRKNMEYSSIRLKVTKGLQRKCLVHMPQKLQKSRHSCHSWTAFGRFWLKKPWPFDPPTIESPRYSHLDPEPSVPWGRLDTSKSLASTGASGQLPATGSQDVPPHITHWEVAKCC